MFSFRNRSPVQTKNAAPLFEMLLVTVLAFASSVTSLWVPPSSGNTNVEISNSVSVNIAEPNPSCPMVGLDCIFNDIERASNSQ